MDLQDDDTTYEQFWDELQSISSGHYQSLSKVEFALSSYISLAARYMDKYLDHDEDLTRCGYHLIHSSIFNNHKAYIRRKLISLLLESDAETQHRMFISAILLIDGRHNSATLEMMQEESAISSIIGTIWKSQMKSIRLHRIFLELLYEMCRIQKLAYSDLALVKTEFLNFLFLTVEDKVDYDYDPYSFAVIKVLLALNEQFMVAAYDRTTHNYNNHTSAPHSSSEVQIEHSTAENETSESETDSGQQVRRIKSAVSVHDLEHPIHQQSAIDYSSVTLENKVFNTLCLNKDKYRTLGENIVFLLNRGPDNTLQLMVLKFLYLIFTTPATYEYLYLNDLKVIVDVFIRELYNLSSEEENLIHTYLRVLHPLLLNTELRREKYKSKELVSLLESMSDNASRYCVDISETTQRLAYRCLFVDWLGAPAPSTPRKSRTFDETFSSSSKARLYNGFQDDSTPSVSTISSMPVSPNNELADPLPEACDSVTVSPTTESHLDIDSTTSLHVTSSAPAYLGEPDSQYPPAAVAQNPQQTGESSRSSCSSRSYDQYQEAEDGMTPTSPISTLSSEMSSLVCDPVDDAFPNLPTAVTPPPTLIENIGKIAIRGVLPPPPPPSRSHGRNSVSRMSTSSQRQRPPPPPPPPSHHPLATISKEAKVSSASSLPIPATISKTEPLPPLPPPPPAAHRLTHAKSSDALRMLGTLGSKRCAPPPPPVPPMPTSLDQQAHLAYVAPPGVPAVTVTATTPPPPPPPSRTLRKQSSTNTLGMSIRNTSALELAYARDMKKSQPSLPPLPHCAEDTDGGAIHHSQSAGAEIESAPPRHYSQMEDCRPIPPHHHHPHHLQKKVSMPSLRSHAGHHHTKPGRVPQPPPSRQHNLPPCPPVPRMYLQPKAKSQSPLAPVAKHPPPPPPQHHYSSAPSTPPPIKNRHLQA